MKDVLGAFYSIWQYVYADEAGNFCEAVEERGISSQISVNYCIYKTFDKKREKQGKNRIHELEQSLQNERQGSTIIFHVAISDG